MHMADALVSATVAGTMYALSAGAAAYSVKKIRLENDDKKIPVMGVMGAFIFAAQMINFTIPGTGSRHKQSKNYNSLYPRLSHFSSIRSI